MCFIIGSSARWVRVKSYDFFLIIHILLALVTLVTLFYHTDRFNGEYDYFLWPCVAFWSFDRACRIGRVIYFHVGSETRKSMVTFSDEDEVIRVDVTDTFRNRSVPGGSHFFMWGIFEVTSALEALLTGQKIFTFRIIRLAKPPFHVGTLEGVSARQYQFAPLRIRRQLHGKDRH